MAAPRVFVSSTFYDLQHVRNDIYSFLKNIGYEPVMHDKGTVTYSQDVPLEESCYSEVDSCDIVVCIIGGQYGSKSETRPGKSITMNEIDAALKNNRLIYIYVQKNVYSEYQTYKANELNSSFIPYHADNIRVLKYISEISSKVRNYPIEQFESSLDIVDKLRQQFAGKFQQLLQRHSSPTEAKTIQNLDDSVSLLKEVVQQAANNFDEITSKIQGSLIFPLQPVRIIMSRLSLSKFRVFLKSEESLDEFLKAMCFDKVGIKDGFRVYVKTISNIKCIKLNLNNNVFDEEGFINDIRDLKKLEEYITLEETIVNDVDDDDLPF